LEFAGTNELFDVPDPYRMSDDAFEQVYQLIDEACRAIVLKLKVD
ncbi:MAG: hypothetical protein ACK560_04790, partial [Bacteroidota bacterium]